MANITRIKNNQITDSTITYVKIAPGTLVGTNFNPELTLNSNVTILGNLTVSGTPTTLNSINTYVSDPLVVFNNGYTSTPSYDIGMLINRNLTALEPYGGVNAAFVWKEADTAFEALMTTETGTTAGSINNSGWANVKLGNLTAISGTFSGALTAPSMTVPTLNVTDGNITTLVSINFSTGNAQITGGDITGLATLTATDVDLTTLVATNFSTGNAQVTGGDITGLATLTATDVDLTTLVATNFSTGNAQITGGDITDITDFSATTGVINNFSSGNAQVTGGDITGLATLTATDADLTTLVATNFSTGNAQVTGGDITSLSTLTATDADLTTLVATNFSTGNAQVTGGDITDITDFSATTGVINNFSSGNVLIDAADLTTLVATNFSTGNAQVTGGDITGLATLTATDADLTTLVATNFSTGNAQVTGGAIDGTPIGADTADTGAFTTLTANNLTTITDNTESYTTTDGALVVTGGVGIGANLNVGGDTYITGNLTVQGTTTTVESTTVTVADLNLTLASGAASHAQADGGGLTVAGADATFTYATSDDSWNINKHLNGLSAEFSNATASTDTTSGALVVTGGVGIGGDVNVGGNVTVDGNISAAAASFASINNTPIGNAIASTGSFTTLVTTDFSTGNAQITGGAIDGTPIGATTADTGAFTTLTSNDVALLTGNIVTGITPSLDTTTGAIVVPGDGGIGIGGNLNAGTHGVSLHNIRGNVLIGLGNITDVADSPLTINLSTETPLLSNATVHVSQATNVSAIMSLDTIGDNNINSHYTARRVRGTNASPAAVQLGDTLGGFLAKGYGATKFSAVSSVNSTGMMAFATENYSDTTQGSRLVLSTTPNGTINAVQGLLLDQTGNIVVISATGSTTTNTGALVVRGGTGIAGNLNVGGQSTYGDVARFASNVVVTSGTEMVDENSGAIVLTNGGGISVGGNAYVGHNLFVGSASLPTDFVNPAVIAVEHGTDYAQMVMKNDTSTGSADYVAYSNLGDDAGGWADMGIAGSEFADSNYTITKSQDGYLITRPTGPSFGGNLVLATSEAGNYNDIVIGVGSFQEDAEVARFHGNTATSGYLDVKVGTNATSETDGAVRITNNGGLGVTGNVFFGNAVTINSTKTVGQDFTVKGGADETLIWARPSATYDQVVIGNSATTGTLVTGAKLIINSTDSMILPTGTTAQRPSNTVGTDVTGMFRFNTTLGYIEFYTGTKWQGVTSQFTIITDEQYNGDGVTVDFTLGAASTTAGTIVSINGVMQIPTLAYTVTETTLTFTEAPATGDIIDVRRLITTQSISGLASTNGYMQVLTDNNGVYIYTGTSGTSATTYWEPNGAKVNSSANISVASSNTPTTIDSFSSTTYRSARYVVQVTHGADYQVSEALVIQDGTTAQVVEYGIVRTNGNLGVLSATISGGNTVLQFIAANATNAVRITKDYNLI